MLLELRRPDHLPGDAHPPPDLPDRRAFRGPGQPQPVDPADLDRIGPAAKDALIDAAADDRTDGPADDRARKAKHRAAETGADGSTSR